MLPSQVLSLKALSAVAAARHVSSDPTVHEKLNVSKLALAVFASGAWTRRETPVYSATLLARMWKVAKVWQVDEEFVYCISRNTARSIHRVRVCLSELSLVDANEKLLESERRQLALLRARLHPEIRRIEVMGEAKYLQGDFHTGPSLPFVSGSYPFLDSIRMPCSLEELCNFLTWPRERQDNVRGIAVNGLDSEERALLSLLPNVDTVYMISHSFSVEDLQSVIALPGKICRLVLYQTRIDGQHVSDVASALKSAGIELVLQEVRVPGDELLVLEERVSEPIRVHKVEDDCRKISGRFKPDSLRVETQIPPIDWKAFLSQAPTQNIWHRDREDRMILNANLPMAFKGAWILHRLEQAQADQSDLICLLNLLCEHYDSLQDLPESEWIAKKLELLLGIEALGCLSMPESWRSLRPPDDPIEAVLPMLDTRAIVFGEDRSELIRSYFQERHLAALAASSDDTKHRILAAVNARNRSQLVLALVCNLISVYGEAAAFQGSLMCRPSSLYRYLKEGKASWLIDECPIILCIRDATEEDWALDLPHHRLSVTGLDLRGDQTAGHREMLKKHFPSVSQIWVSSTWGMENSKEYTLTVARELPELWQSNSPDYWLTDFHEFFRQTVDAAQMAKHGKLAKLHLHLKMVYTRELTQDQLNAIADIAIDLLAAGSLDSSSLEALGAKLRVSARDDSKLLLKFKDGELIVSRRLFRLESQLAARAEEVVELSHASGQAAAALKHCLDSGRFPSSLDLTPREAREFRAICLEWDLAGPRKLLQNYLLTELRNNAFDAFEEWDEHYLSSLTGDERMNIEKTWLAQWAAEQGVLNNGGWRFLPDGIEFSRIGFLSEDSNLGALLRRHVTTLHLPANPPLNALLECFCLLPIELREHFSRIAIQASGNDPPLKLFGSLFPNAETLLAEKKELSLKDRPLVKNHRSSVMRLSLPGKSWSEWNLHLNPDVTASELDAIMPTLLTYAPILPFLLMSQEIIDVLLRRLPHLAQPRELLGVLLTLEKINASDFRKYQLPAQKLPQVDSDWLKVCPFTGRANFSADQLPADLAAALDILKPFSSVCVWGKVSSKIQIAVLFAGKHVRFWHFLKDWNSKPVYEEKTYPAK